MTVDRQLKVLIVEDEFLIGMSLEMTLVDLGHSVLGIATSVDAALEVLGSARPDAAMLDVNLGNGTTSEPIAEVLQQRDIPYFYMTAYDRSFVTFARENDLVLSKPPANEQIDRALRTITAG